MVAWSQRQATLWEFSLINLQSQKALPSQNPTVKTLCFSSYLGNSGLGGLIFLICFLPLHHLSFLSYSLLSQPTFYLLMFYMSDLFASINFSLFLFHFNSYFCIWHTLSQSQFFCFYSVSCISSFSPSFLAYSHNPFFSTPCSAPFSAQFRQHVCCSPLWLALCHTKSIKGYQTD